MLDRWRERHQHPGVSRIARRGLGILSAALALLGVISGSAALGSADIGRIGASVRIVSVTPQVAQGGVVTVIASVSAARASCGLSLRPPMGRALPVSPRKRTSRGRLKWLVRMRADAAAGRWTLTVTCPGTGRATAHFTVAPKVVPAQITVEKSGFSQQSTGGQGTEIAYGLILINQSTTTDARDVTVNVKFLDSRGRSVTTWTSTVAVIPAATRFYLAGKAFSDNPLAVASMQVSLTVDATPPKSVVLPPVTNVATSPSGLGTSDVTGELTNPYPKPIPKVATIYAVILDDHGNIIGGGYEQTRAQVQPGATVDFHLTYFDLFPTPAGAAAQVSVDPCGGISFDCAALAP
jgi:hypothetical protein